MPKDRTRDPARKKVDSLDRDHRTTAEYPHGFRIGWPRKEAAAQRKFRRGTRQALRAPDAEQAELAATSLRRGQVKKWPNSVITVREHNQQARAARAKRDGRKKRSRSRAR